uniref:Uncharacterized protein n=1 Tax=Ficedula albicollis TaxID=59894 RepID=A0A803VCJ6_FICAL
VLGGPHKWLLPTQKRGHTNMGVAAAFRALQERGTITVEPGGKAPFPAPPPAPLHHHLTGGISQSSGQGRSLKRGKSLSVPNTCISLQTCCQVPLPGWMAFEAQCLSAAVPITSGPLCVLPHCLAMTLSHKKQHQQIVPPGGLDPRVDSGQQ